MNRELISVVISTYDREQYLLECLASVLSQPYPAFEVLIVDPSAAGTLPSAMERKFGKDTRIRYFRMERAGLSKARNCGVQNATGTIVAFIDDDAIAQPSWLEAMAEVLECTPGAGLVTGRIDPIWMKERPKWYPTEREFLLGIYNIGDQVRELPEHDLPFGGNMAGWRELILKCGGFDERFGFNHFGKRPLLSGEDSLLAEHVKRAGHKLYYSPRAVIRHRITAQKLTRKYFLRRHFWEGVTTIERMAVLGQVSPDMFQHYRYHAKAVSMGLARALLPAFDGRYPLARPVIRMLALSRAASNCGVLYGLFGMHRDLSAKKRT